jgi:hypothetical protein
MAQKQFSLATKFWNQFVEGSSTQLSNPSQSKPNFQSSQLSQSSSSSSSTSLLSLTILNDNPTFNGASNGQLLGTEIKKITASVSNSSGSSSTAYISPAVFSSFVGSQVTKESGTDLHRIWLGGPMKQSDWDNICDTKKKHPERKLIMWTAKRSFSKPQEFIKFKQDCVQMGIIMLDFDDEQNRTLPNIDLILYYLKRMETAYAGNPDKNCRNEALCISDIARFAVLLSGGNYADVDNRLMKSLDQGVDSDIVLIPDNAADFCISCKPNSSLVKMILILSKLRFSILQDLCKPEGDTPKMIRRSLDHDWPNDAAKEEVDMIKFRESINSGNDQNFVIAMGAWLISEAEDILKGKKYEFKKKFFVADVVKMTTPMNESFQENNKYFAILHALTKFYVLSNWEKIKLVLDASSYSEPEIALTPCEYSLYHGEIYDCRSYYSLVRKFGPEQQKKQTASLCSHRAQFCGSVSSASSSQSALTTGSKAPDCTNLDTFLATGGHIRNWF